MEAQPSRKKKFIRDIGVYAVGNIGSKLITFLLVPFYTHYITDPSRFGYYDLCLTAIFILSPILVFQLNDGGFRFLINTSGDGPERTRIITFVYKTLLRNGFVALLLGVVAMFCLSLMYLPYIVAYMIVMSYYDVTVQLVRGLGDNKLYVSAGILTAFLVALFSVLFLALFGMGIDGIFLANILARGLSMVMIEVQSHLLRRYLRLSEPTGRVGREILRYSLPILPGILCWYLISSGNKFLIEHNLGLTENGLYAVAFKFSTILQTLAWIFYQAWQENAIRQYDTPDRDRFFSQVFNNYTYLLSGLVMIFPFLLRWNYFWLTGPEYQDSAQYLYLLAVCAMLYSMASFFDLGYQCSKQTHRAILPFVLAAAVSVVFNLTLIGPFGIYGIIIANLLSYMVLLVYRAVDTRKYFSITVEPSSGRALALVVCGTVVYQLLPGGADVLCVLALCVLFIIFAPASFRQAVTAPLHRSRTSHN